MKKESTALIVIFLLSTSLAYTQQNDSCRVLMDELSGTYNGDCKEGLAHGKGVAKGKDSYTGDFMNGLPEGKGTYVYENGNSFTGSWTNGLKHGKGKFVYYSDGKEQIQKGYWRHGDYAGLTEPGEFYRVTTRSGIEYYSFKKVEGSKEVRIKISFVGAMVKNIPQDLRVTTSSGQVNQEYKNFVIYNYTRPNNCVVTFTIRTAGGTRSCNLTFDILELGNYEVVITNN